MGECLAVLKINPSFNYIADLPASPKQKRLLRYVISIGVLGKKRSNMCIKQVTYALYSYHFTYQAMASIASQFYPLLLLLYLLWLQR